MSGQISGATLVKNPLFWLSIIAIIAVLLCLAYILMSRARKQRHTTNSTIDIKHVVGKDGKDKFNDKQFRKELLDEVDKKIKKDRDDSDKKNEEQNKKNEEKMKKLEDEIEAIKVSHQELLANLGAQFRQMAEQVIEEKFGEGEIEGDKLKRIREIIAKAVDQATQTASNETNNALTMAQQYADNYYNQLVNDPTWIKNHLTQVLEQYISTPPQEVRQLNNEIDKKLFINIYATIDKEIRRALSNQRKLLVISPHDRPDGSFYVSPENAERIERLMCNAGNSDYNDTITLPSYPQEGEFYQVSQHNIESIFPTLALATLKHPLLYPRQGQ